jgi:tetratricopeptide (TPR) repeat protein
MQRHVVSMAISIALFLTTPVLNSLRSGVAPPAKAGWPPLVTAGWLKAQTKHFTLIGDASEQEIRGVGTRLEQFREAFTQVYSQLISSAAIKSSIPITVIVFKNDLAYRPFKPVYQGRPAEVSGYFQSSGDSGYITLAAGSSERNPYAIIFHEYVHALTIEGAGAYSSALPTWLSEGLAEYFSAFEVASRGRAVRLGAAVATHARLLREREFLPLKTLLTVDQTSPFYLEAEKKNLFYAESWALTHYLLHGGGGKRRPQFRQFIDSVAKGEPAGDSFTRAFQTDLATLERELRLYAARGAYLTEELTFDQRVEFDAGIKTGALGDAEVQAYLGDLLWRIQRSAEGEVFLTRALSIDPKLAMASLSLGTLRLRQNRYAEARTFLGRAIDAGSQNFLAFYDYAYAIHREHVDESQYVSELPETDVKTMREALVKARQLNPDFADTYKLLAFIDLVTNEDLDGALALITRAIELAPYRDDIVYTRAQIQMRRKDFAAARQIAQTLVEGAGKSDIRERAKFMLENISRIEERLARMKAEGVTADGPPRRPEGPRPRPLGPGQRFQGDQVRGYLTRIDCDDASITLTVKSESRLFKLHTSQPGQLTFVRYTPEISNSVLCGPISPAKPVIVTYRSSPLPAFDGEPIGVEFVKPDVL